MSQRIDIPQIYTVNRNKLYEINKLLHLSNRNMNQYNAKQIIKELREQYINIVVNMIQDIFANS